VLEVLRLEDVISTIIREGGMEGGWRRKKARRREARWGQTGKKNGGQGKTFKKQKTQKCRNVRLKGYVILYRG